MYNLIILNDKDNVAVAPMNIPNLTDINSNLKTLQDIPFGHKIALTKIKKNSFVYKYGQIIGIALIDILPGQHVHTHNLEFSEFERIIKSSDLILSVALNLFSSVSSLSFSPNSVPSNLLR